MSTVQPLVSSRTHLTRLMKIWRSAGWPCRDPIEIDLLASGWLALVVSDAGHEVLRVTASGIQVLAESRQRNARAMSRHDRLAQHVGRQLQEAGRVVWLELMLRAQVKAEPDPAVPMAKTTMEALPDLGLWAPGELSSDEEAARQAAAEPKGVWRMARPDVFSVRNTTVESYLQPVVHEIKVSRADLLSDLRNPAKREAYRWLCSACYYVFPVGIAQPNEIPPEFGVWVLHGDVDDGRLEQLRPARHAPCKLPFAVWMAMAKSTPWRVDLEESQGQLGELQESREPDAREPDAASA